MSDPGGFGATVIDHRDSCVGRRIEIAGDDLTSVESAAVLTTVLGRPIAAAQVPMEQIRAFSEDLALMYEWFMSTGYSIDIEHLRATTPEVGWQRFADWATKNVPPAL